MDAVTELIASDEGGKRVVDQYVVAGGSKRGWTTWLVGAVDKRVVGIAPIVIDILNLEKSMNHHFSAYGFYAPSITDYVEHHLVQKRDHPRMQELFALVDPYLYRHRLTMPKFVLNASGDQFFPPDLSRHYFDELQGEKYLRYVPNADHGLDGSDALESLVAFYSLVLAGKEGPNFSWERTAENAFRIKTVDKPQKVTLWKATNPEARDFRIESLGPQYESQVLVDQGEGTYVAEVAVPEDGWTAFFAELTYDVGAPTRLKVTTNVGIVPDVFPFADKDPALPTSLTIHCLAPNEDVVQKIRGSLDSPEMKAVAEDPQLSINGEAAEKGVSIVLNWIPKGRFEKSARAIAGYLEKMGCGKFVFLLESGRLAPPSK
jgi:PhoPQ-activated pathogenicity-related protein